QGGNDAPTSTYGTRNGLPRCLCCGTGKRTCARSDGAHQESAGADRQTRKPCGRAREQASVLLRWLPTVVGHDRVHSCAASRNCARGASAGSHSTASDPKPRSGNTCPGAVYFSILADPRIWERRFFGDQSTEH